MTTPTSEPQAADEALIARAKDRSRDVGVTEARGTMAEHVTALEREREAWAPLIDRLSTLTQARGQSDAGLSELLALSRKALEPFAAERAHMERAYGNVTGYPTWRGLDPRDFYRAHEAYEALRSLETKSAPTPLKTAWQSIETAPKDDTLFLAATGDGRMMIWNGKILATATARGTPNHLSFPATHWMPLPQPPAPTPPQPKDLTETGGEGK